MLWDNDEWQRGVESGYYDDQEWYDEESSKYLVKIAFENVKESFEFKESAYDFAVVYGFSGG